MEIYSCVEIVKHVLWILTVYNGDNSSVLVSYGVVDGYRYSEEVECFHLYAQPVQDGTASP
jgi:hypothetical protein